MDHVLHHIPISVRVGFIVVTTAAAVTLITLSAYTSQGFDRDVLFVGLALCLHLFQSMYGLLFRRGKLPVYRTMRTLGVGGTATFVILLQLSLARSDLANCISGFIVTPVILAFLVVVSTYLIRREMEEREVADAKRAEKEAIERFIVIRSDLECIQSQLAGLQLANVEARHRGRSKLVRVINALRD